MIDHIKVLEKHWAGRHEKRVPISDTGIHSDVAVISSRILL